MDGSMPVPPAVVVSLCGQHHRVIRIELGESVVAPVRGELSSEIAVIVLCDHPIVFRVFRDNHVHPPSADDVSYVGYVWVSVFRRFLDRGHDILIAGTPAEVSTEPFANLNFAGIRYLFQ